MRISIGLPSAVSPPTGTIVVDWAREAEALGFSSLSVIDRVLADTYDPLTVLAAAAAVTTRVELMTAVVLAPLRPAAILATQAATVDQISAGRLTLGLGVGSREEDYVAADADYRRRGRTLDVQIKQMRAAWRGSGEFAVGPRPYRAGGPPLLFGGYSEATVRRVTEVGEGWICARGGAAAFSPMAERICKDWAVAGREGRPRLMSVVNYSLGQDADAVRDTFMRAYYGTKPFVQDMIDETPTTIDGLHAVLNEHDAAGCDGVVLLPCAPALGQLELLAGSFTQLQ